MGFGLFLTIVGIILIVISAFWNPAFSGTRPRAVSFWNLGWGFVLAGVLLFGDAQIAIG